VELALIQDLASNSKRSKPPIGSCSESNDPLLGVFVHGVRYQLCFTGKEYALMVDIHGNCSEEFIGVREVLAKNLDSGADVGASAAVFIDGRRIAYWGGSGGSFVMNDLDAHVTVAFVMNRHPESSDVDQRSIDVIKAAYDALMSR
jgi:hypothetical protein